MGSLSRIAEGPLRASPPHRGEASEVLRPAPAVDARGGPEAPLEVGPEAGSEVAPGEAPRSVGGAGAPPTAAPVAERLDGGPPRGAHANAFWGGPAPASAPSGRSDEPRVPAPRDEATTRPDGPSLVRHERGGEPGAPARPVSEGPRLIQGGGASPPAFEVPVVAPLVVAPPVVAPAAAPVAERAREGVRWIERVLRTVVSAPRPAPAPSGRLLPSAGGDDGSLLDAPRDGRPRVGRQVDLVRPEPESLSPLDVRGARPTIAPRPAASAVRQIARAPLAAAGEWARATRIERGVLRTEFVRGPAERSEAAVVEGGRAEPPRAAAAQAGGAPGAAASVAATAPAEGRAVATVAPSSPRAKAVAPRVLAERLTPRPPASERVVHQAASASPAPPPERGPRVSVSIGRVEVRSRARAAPSPVAVTGPRDHMIDPGSPFGGPASGSW